MTRLDANGEPSMEEILASIRKIIAEDPPGSRAGPAKQSDPSHSPLQRGAAAPSMRGSYFPTLSGPSRGSAFAAPSSMPSLDMPSAGAGLAAGEPAPAGSGVVGVDVPMASAPGSSAFGSNTLGSGGLGSGSLGLGNAASGAAGSAPAAPQAGADSAALSGKPAFRATPFAAMSNGPEPAPLAEKNAGAAERVEPSFAVLARPAAPESSAKPGDAEAREADTALSSIEAQLSELFDDVSPDPGAWNSNVSGNSAPPSAAPFAWQSPPVPELSQAPSHADFMRTQNGSISRPAESTPSDADPFDFDLGPSPFASKPHGNAEGDAAKAKPASPSAIGVEASRISSGPAKNGHAAGVTITPVKSSSMAQPEVEGGTAASVKVERTASPSPEPEHAAKASHTDRNDGASGVVGAKHDVMEFASQLMLTETASGAAASVDMPGVESSTRGTESVPAQGDAVPAPPVLAQQRSMEDTVAELLRPMLRTWLAENMPRIVEQALKRELKGETLSGWKNSVE